MKPGIYRVKDDIFTRHPDHINEMQEVVGHEVKIIMLNCDTQVDDEGEIRTVHAAKVMTGPRTGTYVCVAVKELEAL